MDTTEFVSLWSSEEPEGFNGDPPNAVLEVRDSTGALHAFAIVLREPVYEGTTGGLEYIFSLREDFPDFYSSTKGSGELPEEFGKASLFIDAFPTAVNSQITD